MGARKVTEPSDFARMVGKRIRAARGEIGLSQPDFGKKVGQSATTIRSWEKGDTSPRVTDLRKISEVTKKSIAWFVSTEKPPHRNGMEAKISEAALTEGGVSVESPSGEEESAHLHPGFAIRGGGRDQLIIDFIVRGQRDRVVIADVSAREENPDG